MFKPLPHPATECPFYRGGWQNFLVATQPDADRQARADDLDYPTIDDVSRPRSPRPARSSYLGDIKQAGAREILIDQNGNTLYYGIHVNQAFADFIHQNSLETPNGAPQDYPNDPATEEPVLPARASSSSSPPGSWSRATAPRSPPQTAGLHQHEDHRPDAEPGSPTHGTAHHRGPHSAAPGHGAAARDPRRLHAAGPPGVHLGQLRAQHRGTRPTPAPPTASATWRRSFDGDEPDDADTTEPHRDHAGRRDRTTTCSTRRAPRPTRPERRSISETDLHLVGQKFMNPDMHPAVDARSTACSRRRSRTPPTPTTRSPR